MISFNLCSFAKGSISNTIFYFKRKSARTFDHGLEQFDHCKLLKYIFIKISVRYLIYTTKDKNEELVAKILFTNSKTKYSD